MTELARAMKALGRETDKARVAFLNLLPFLPADPEEDDDARGSA